MKHANICEYKHFFEDKVNCYILLELCHNHSMNEMIKRCKYLTEEETRLLRCRSSTPSPSCTTATSSIAT